MKKTKTLTQADYAKLGLQIRSQILQTHRPDSCIETTAAAIDALRQIGVSAYPLSVTVCVLNEPLWRYSEANHRFPVYGEPDYPPDGYGIGVGFAGDDREKRWPGHLVAVAERRWMLDFSIDQANRPDWGIELGPAVLEVDEPFLRGASEEATVGMGRVYRQGNVWLGYTTRVADKSFKETAPWTINRPKVQLFAKRGS